jgi:hypothetical protein
MNHDKIANRVCEVFGQPGARVFVCVELPSGWTGGRVGEDCQKLVSVGFSPREIVITLERSRLVFTDVRKMKSGSGWVTLKRFRQATWYRRDEQESGIRVFTQGEVTLEQCGTY